MVNDEIAGIVKDKDAIKQQLGERDKTDGELFFRRFFEQLKPVQCSTIRYTLAINGAGIWGHPDAANGDWGTAVWGSADAGENTVRDVVNPDHTWKEYLRHQVFVDSSNTTATVDTTNHKITF